MYFVLRVDPYLFIYFVRRMFPIFLLFFPLCQVQKVKSALERVVLAPWRRGPVGTFNNHLEVSTSPAVFFCFSKGMFTLLKTRVNGARYRSPEGSL